ncbi:aldo/keto reductase [Paenibacillus glycinis]|uniref:aldo/keto reductase n=1 Tax=Paenibacillus glycinis TaxID=2697035 RepID=UPI0022A75269|nr:aldo/keto reductase [Paenibacillus glycinis]
MEPAGGGFLSGKYSREQPSVDGSRRTDLDFPPVNKERAYDIIAVLKEMAEQKQATVAQVALSWLLHQSAVTSVIIGTKRIEQLDENIGATTIRLTEAELQTLNEASKLPAEYPSYVGDMEFVENATAGGIADPISRPVSISAR